MLLTGQPQGLALPESPRAEGDKTRRADWTRNTPLLTVSAVIGTPCVPGTVEMALRTRFCPLSPLKSPVK